MKKITYNDKLNAIMAYFFGLFICPFLIKNKSSFLKSHVRRGQIINIVLLIWLVIIIILYRILSSISLLSIETVIIIKMIFNVLNGIFCVLILLYQFYWIIKILKKWIKLVLLYAGITDCVFFFVWYGNENFIFCENLTCWFFVLVKNIYFWHSDIDISW